MSRDLLLKRKKLIHLLPNASNPDQLKLKKMIKRIDRKLKEVGSLEFMVPSPAGLGRLVLLPFYPVNAHVDIVTSAGQNAASSQNPSMIALIGNTTNNAMSSFVLKTPQISWAKLRVVGFQVTQKTFSSQISSAPMLLCSELKIGGSTNLFTHETSSNASMYDDNLNNYAGLRDYPDLISPNQAEVTFSAVSPTATGDRITFSAFLICDVLDDADYGKHLVGPYARGASVIRKKSRLNKGRSSKRIKR